MSKNKEAITSAVQQVDTLLKEILPLLNSQQENLVLDIIGNPRAKTIIDILINLQDGCSSVEELASKLGMNKKTLIPYLDEMTGFLKVEQDGDNIVLKKR